MEQTLDPIVQWLMANKGDSKTKGGLRILADACGISKQAVAQWRTVPRWHVETVERVTGISRYDLRPDIFRRVPYRLEN